MWLCEVESKGSFWAVVRREGRRRRRERGREGSMILGWVGMDFLLEMLMVSTLLGVNRSIVGGGGDDGSLGFFFAERWMDGVGVGYVCNVYTWLRYIGFWGRPKR